MAYEDATKSHIELLIENKNWKAAYAALEAYISKMVMITGPKIQWP